MGILELKWMDLWFYCIWAMIIVGNGKCQNATTTKSMDSLGITKIGSSVDTVTPRIPVFFGSTVGVSIQDGNSTVSNPTSPSMTSSTVGGSSTTTSSDAADEILFVAATWRHGERYPVEFFPGDINTAEDFPEGEITLNGMDQLFELGLQLRSRYVDSMGFVSSRYDPGEIHVRSTDVNRTLISAQSVLAGLYSSESLPGADYPSVTGWPEGFVPVPIHVNPLEDEILIPFYSNCSRKDQLWEILESTSFYSNFINESMPFIDEINNHTGLDYGIFEALGVIDTVTVESTLGLPTVSWAIPYLEDFSRIFATYMGSLMGFGDLADHPGPDLDLEKELSINLFFD